MSLGLPAADAGSQAPPPRPSVLPALLGALLALVAVIYPLIVWFGLTRWSARAVGLLLLVCVAPALLSRLARTSPEDRRAILAGPAVVAALVVLCSALDDHRFLLALPVAINAVLLVSFGVSLWGPVSLVERYARMQHSELSSAELRYCRSVTVSWCIFFVLNGAVAAVFAVAGSTASWALYTGGLSYALLGLLFAAEFSVRKVRFRRYGTGLIDRLFERYFPGPRRQE